MLRSAERAHQMDPTEASLRLLQDTRVRVGLGWHGEALPPRVTPIANERGVYAFELPCHPPADGTPVPLSFTDLVYVPGGEVECSRCDGGTRGYGTPIEVREGRASCIDCRDTPGKHRLAPMYVDRFPVTWIEYLAGSAPGNDIARRGRTDGYPMGSMLSPYHPVVNVTHDESRAFCEWAGLRLPTANEWRAAALGYPIRHPRIFGGERFELVRVCPWGDEDPTPDRCVWSEWFDPDRESVELKCEPGTRKGDYVSAGPDGTLHRSPADARPFGFVVADPRYVPNSHLALVVPLDAEPATQPVVVQERQKCAACVVDRDGTWSCMDLARDAHPATGRLVPARPRGASWCGAHDMCGNVWERVAESDRIFGGSFLSRADTLARSITRPINSAPSNAVGFRVALSGAS